MGKNKKTGLVLSGGGVRGIAHIGLIKVLEDHDIIPDIISGTSSGALVGALYAKGYPAETMMDFFHNTPLFRISFFAKNKPGLLDMEKYQTYLKEYFPEDSFELLKKQLYVTATNLEYGRLDYFSSGELIKPLLASAALPPVFSPVMINVSLYVDGGIMNNFPVDPLQNTCDFILSSFVNPIERVDKENLNSTRKVLDRIYHLGNYSAAQVKFNLCQYVFRPNGIENISTLDKKQIDIAYQIGYDHALKEIDVIKNALGMA